MIWFTSDTHFFHNKEFCYGERGFSSPEEMNEEIIKRHNELVNEDDVVYFLGDCGLTAHVDDIIYCLGKMNGTKYLIIGNHDSDARIVNFIKSAVFKDVLFGDRFRYKKIEFIFSHYPMLVANFDDPKPIWNIHGHLHSPDHFHDNLPHCFQVSMESNNCYPISIDEIVDLIKKLNIKGETK